MNWNFGLSSRRALLSGVFATSLAAIAGSALAEDATQKLVDDRGVDEPLFPGQQVAPGGRAQPVGELRRGDVRLQGRLYNRRLSLVHAAGLRAAVVALVILTRSLHRWDPIPLPA